MGKELDFDELDKAVSSLMGSIPKTDSPVSDATTAKPAEPVVSPAAKPVESTGEKVIVKPSAPTPQPQAAPVNAPQQPAAGTRSAGRFMDVVHPSADMKSRPAGNSNSAPSREGIAITPRPSLGTSPETKKDDTTLAPNPMPLEATTPDIMPDPIAMAKPKDEPVSLSGSPEPFASKTEDAVKSPEKEEVKPALPAGESPFLPNTNVEKRPLGNEPPTGGDEKEDLSADKLVDDNAASDYPPAQALPAELNNDLVAIEAKELTTHVPTKTEKPEKEEPPKPPEPTSITPQYKEQPSTGDDSHTAIYDTSQMPQPLAHPVKKKAGWLWIVWVMLLLALGAGGAALLYATGIIP